MPQHLKEYFDTYPGFEYNPSNPPTDEFRRLCKTHEWSSPNESAKQTPFFRAALVREFNAMYGKADSEFHHWQYLRRVLEIDLATIDECREVRRSSLLSWLARQADTDRWPSENANYPCQHYRPDPLPKIPNPSREIP